MNLNLLLDAVSQRTIRSLQTTGRVKIAVEPRKSAAERDQQPRQDKLRR